MGWKLMMVGLTDFDRVLPNRRHNPNVFVVSVRRLKEDGEAGTRKRLDLDG